MEDHVAAAKSLTTAKSVQEVVELQTTFAKSSLEAYLAEMNKWLGHRLRLGEGIADARSTSASPPRSSTSRPPAESRLPLIVGAI